jgi:prepilin-type N-terminal cleavage/methylation domain-containing protein
MKLFLSPRRNRSLSGMTLVEIMVATAVGSIALAAVMSLFLYSVRSFVAMGNYADLDRASRNALDLMSREIRSTRSLSSFSATHLQFVDYDDTSLTYRYNPSTRQLVREKASTNRTVMLQQCDFLEFHVSQRNPSNNFTFYPTTNASQAKLIDVSWRCSREILGARVNTESVQTAKIVVRN